MIRLKRVVVHKYKCFENLQEFEVTPDITVLVGMNESGKTAILEAIAKTNYFYEDDRFKFNATHDYPRKEKKKMEKSGQKAEAVTCLYEITGSILESIEDDIGDKVLKKNEFKRSNYIDTTHSWFHLDLDQDKFIDNKTKELMISNESLIRKLKGIKKKDDFNNILKEFDDTKDSDALKEINKYFANEWDWERGMLSEYIYRTWIKANMPKFLYYDEYYALPSRISIEKLQLDKLESDSLKTAKALFELADIDIDELINSDDFEDYKAELEATEATITQELFEFWSTNKNLEIQFDIDKIEKTDPQDNTRIVEHVLDIRVRNNRAKVSLPLKNRSKGFNWFFSFLVWFKKIQEDPDTNYILLLDEPGLNLHASAQADLLEFIESLSETYQILYTTHSPFMIKSSKLNRVRTIVEKQNGSIISDSFQEKDPNTLFPLQAALGYDIAQNLFISKNNLLVEGVSDLIFIELISGLLEELNRESLSNEITIVPAGGLDKVSSFVSLLRGNKLNIVCLLDSSIDTGNKTKIENLVKQKIIKKNNILFYHQFIEDFDEADIEDVFNKDEYINLFNLAHPEYKNIKVPELNKNIKRIVLQINKKLGLKR